MPHVCPWWGGYFIDNRLRRFLHKPEMIVAPYVKQGTRVMDFGCGMGFFSIALAKMVGDSGSVIAVDLQKRMLDVLQKRALRAGVGDRIRTHQCERDSIGIEEPVDFALAFWSIHEVPDARSLLGEIQRCLADGGRLLVAEPKGHVSATEFEEMVDVAQDVGLEPEESLQIRLSRATVFAKR
jgi:ubiquinone/menaquinone biosynthesis C-methylase UbiE